MVGWDEAARLVAAQTVMVESHVGRGTGFLIDRDGETGLLTIGTAHHVIEHAGNEPVRITVPGSGTLVINDGASGMTYARMNDLDAVVIICKCTGDVPVPTVPLLDGPESVLNMGIELGWLGFPRVAPGQLCFFSGRVSAIERDWMLVDGTAIHGVSGGPAFCITDDGPKIVGSITAYLPNRIEEDGTLPGLSLVTNATAMTAIGVQAVP